MASNETTIRPKEFECIIVGTEDKSIVTEGESRTGQIVMRRKLKHAAFTLETHGPFPYDELHKLQGRRVRVTILD